MSVDQALKRAETSRHLFEQELRQFARDFGPRDSAGELHEFQMALTRLMVSAMQHKSDVLGYGLQIYADAQWAQQALKPLIVLMEEPK